MAHAQWAAALRHYQFPVEVGQRLTRDHAVRVCRVFFDAPPTVRVKLLRWWLLFRTECVPCTSEELVALTRYNLWKEAIVAAVVSDRHNSSHAQELTELLFFQRRWEQCLTIACSQPTVEYHDRGSASSALSRPSSEPAVARTWSLASCVNQVPSWGSALALCEALRVRTAPLIFSHVERLCIAIAFRNASYDVAYSLVDRCPGDHLLHWGARVALAEGNVERAVSYLRKSSIAPVTLLCTLLRNNADLPLSACDICIANALRLPASYRLLLFAMLHAKQIFGGALQAGREDYVCWLLEHPHPPTSALEAALVWCIAEKLNVFAERVTHRLNKFSSAVSCDAAITSQVRSGSWREALRTIENFRRSQPPADLLQRALYESVQHVRSWEAALVLFQ